MLIAAIEEEDYILTYLQRRGLVEQYRKAKQQILQGTNSGAKLKQRLPKDSGAWYFRINRQRRAIGYFEENVLYITNIDNHQN